MSYWELWEGWWVGGFGWVGVTYHVAHEDLLHVFPLDARPGHSLLDGNGTELRGSEAGETALELACE